MLPPGSLRSQPAPPFNLRSTTLTGQLLLHCPPLGSHFISRASRLVLVSLCRLASGLKKKRRRRELSYLLFLQFCRRCLEYLAGSSNAIKPHLTFSRNCFFEHLPPVSLLRASRESCDKVTLLRFGVQGATGRFSRHKRKAPFAQISTKPWAGPRLVMRIGSRSTYYYHDIIFARRTFQVSRSGTCHVRVYGLERRLSKGQ